MPAGKLRYRVGFYRRDSVTGDSPDYGSGEGYPGTATFVVWGNIEARLGGEQIMAGRLAGKNLVNILVRQSSATSQVTEDWIAKNEDTQEIYNIRSVIDRPQNPGVYWEMLCEKGVAT